MLLKVEKLTTDIIGPLSFDINDNEILCISGPSGCGKSMLLRCLADLTPHSGTIDFKNKKLSEYSPPVWRKTVSLLPANSEWWHLTVGQHFEKTLLTDFIKSGLKKLGFAESALSWRIDQISSGEKQRFALLRLLQNKPRLLLLDEPTANLDPKATANTEDLIQQYQQSNHCSIIWVSHDQKQIKRVAQRHLQMHSGTFRPAAL